MECNIFWEQIELKDSFIYSLYSTSKSGRAGIAGIVVIDLDGLRTFIPE